MLKKTIIAILNLVNWVMPKKDIIVFNSYPDVAGNSMALYRYIAEEHAELFEKYRIIWAVNGNAIKEGKSVLEIISGHCKYEIVKKKTLKGFLIYCRARYIITTHNYISGLYTHGTQKNYQLWHGMPLKTIGRLKKVPSFIQGDYGLATSPLFQEIIGKALGLPLKNIMVTGQPCNDALFQTNDARRKLGINTGKKMLVWMPTYRQAVEGETCIDGRVESFGVRIVLAKHFEELNAILEQKNMVLIIKPHPMDAINKMKLKSSKNIVIMHNSDLNMMGVSLYEMVGEADILLTDYSSIYIDYLCTQKPMAFLFDDMEVYQDNRGFLFENPMEYLPGEKISCWAEFRQYLENDDLINDRWKESREKIGKLFHVYMDAKSSERVYKFIFEQ